MSAVAAVVDRQSFDVARRLDRLAEVIRPFGRDGLRRWSDRHCGLVHAHLWTLPEDVQSVQPLNSDGDGLHLIAEARLDNREELNVLLRADLPVSIPTDAQLILAAYRRWDVECARRMVGDFAFVIWDARRQRVFAARDVFGTRPLFYAFRGSRLALASTMKAVIAAFDQPAELNREVVAETARGTRTRWVHETAIAGVYRLPAAHALEASLGGAPQLQRYYVLGSQPPDGLTTDAHWREAFTAAFEQSVRARLRSQTPVVVLGGGGLDSSAVFCQAAALRQDGEPSPEVRLLSATFDRTPDADERQYLRAIGAQWPDASIDAVLCDDCLSTPTSESVEHGFEEPEVVHHPAMSKRLVRRVASSGSRVILGGQGADLVLYSGSYENPQVLHDWPIWDRLRELRSFRVPRWRMLTELTAGRIERVLRPRRPIPMLPPPALSTWCAWIGYRGLCAGPAAGYAGWRSALGLNAGVDMRFPFLDRPLAELLLSMPMSMRCRAGESKFLLRTALDPILPELVRRRVGKSWFDQLVLDGLLKEQEGVQRMIGASRLVEEGLIDHRLILGRWKRFQARPAFDVALPVLWFCLTERWLRRFRAGVL